jgi:hypothetical protein
MMEKLFEKLASKKPRTICKGGAASFTEQAPASSIPPKKQRITFNYRLLMVFLGFILSPV